MGVILAISLIIAVSKTLGVSIPINNLALSRVPIFVIGIIVGILCLKKYTFTQYAKKFWVGISLIGIIVMLYLVRQYSHQFLWTTMLYWLPFTIITPGLCILLNLCVDKAPQIVKVMLRFIGVISLEIYLVHLLFLKQYISLVGNTTVSPIVSWLSGIGFILFSILCGYILSVVLKLTQSWFNQFMIKSKLLFKSMI